MTAGSDSTNAVAGGLARHIPVLVRTAIRYLAPRPGGIYVDATFGAGGYSREILAAADCRVIGIDRDHSAITRASDMVAAAGGRLSLVEATFSDLEAVMARCAQPAIDGIVFDLGVSSMQLDEAERGFSFRQDGPLDMRMGYLGPTAADLVAQASQHDLAHIIATLGEERHARAIARALVRARNNSPIRSTRALADIVVSVVHARPGLIHPATRTFQALRMFVNDELGELAAGLIAAERLLKPGGRLVVVAFQSLEDRIVKTFLAERSERAAGGSRHRPQAPRAPSTFELLTTRPAVPDETEVADNPRARSAKLRAAVRTAAAPREAGSDLLPPLPPRDRALGQAGRLAGAAHSVARRRR
ncbi:MAG: 16S rRNA (cytosine(1402)-N(4))-methyltransferase RsmH [Xanthobacteraceae bacterium]